MATGSRLEDVVEALADTAKLSEAAQLVREMEAFHAYCRTLSHCRPGDVEREKARGNWETWRGERIAQGARLDSMADRLGTRIERLDLIDPGPGGIP